MAFRSRIYAGALAVILYVSHAHLTWAWTEVRCYQNTNVFQPKTSHSEKQYQFEPKHPGEYTFQLTATDFCEEYKQNITVRAMCKGPEFVVTLDKSSVNYVNNDKLPPVCAPTSCPAAGCANSQANWVGNPPRSIPAWSVRTNRCAKSMFTVGGDHNPPVHRPYLCVYPAEEPTEYSCIAWNAATGKCNDATTFSEKKLLETLDKDLVDAFKAKKANLDLHLKWKARRDCYKWKLYNPLPVKSLMGEESCNGGCPDQLISSKTAELQSPDRTRLSFYPDIPYQDYVVRLAVDDGCSIKYESVTMRAKCNCPPIPNAGKPATVPAYDDWVKLKKSYTLDGSGTTDDDLYDETTAEGKSKQRKLGDTLTYKWDLINWDPALRDDMVYGRDFVGWKESLEQKVSVENGNMKLTYQWSPKETTRRGDPRKLADSVRSDPAEGAQPWQFESRGFYRPVTECRRWNGKQFVLITPQAGTPYTGPYHGAGTPLPSLTTENFLAPSGKPNEIVGKMGLDMNDKNMSQDLRGGAAPTPRTITSDFEVSDVNSPSIATSWFSTPYYPVPGMAFSTKNGASYADGKMAMKVNGQPYHILTSLKANTRDAIRAPKLNIDDVTHANYVATMVDGVDMHRLDLVGKVSDAVIDATGKTVKQAGFPNEANLDCPQSAHGPCKYYYMGPNPVDARGFEIGPGGTYYGPTTSAAPYIIFSYAYQEKTSMYVEESVQTQAQPVCKLTLNRRADETDPIASFTFDDFQACRGTFCFKLRVSDGCNGEFTDVQDKVCITVGCNQKPISDLQSNQTSFYDPRKDNRMFQEVHVDGRRYGDRDIDVTDQKGTEKMLKVTWSAEHVGLAQAGGVLDATGRHGLTKLNPFTCAQDLFGEWKTDQKGVRDPKCLCTDEQKQDPQTKEYCDPTKSLKDFNANLFQYDNTYTAVAPYRKLLPPVTGLYSVTMAVADACSTSVDSTYIDARCSPLMAQVLPSTVKYSFSPTPSEIRPVNAAAGANHLFSGVVLDGTKSIFNTELAKVGMATMPMQYAWELKVAPRYSKFCNPYAKLPKNAQSQESLANGHIGPKTRTSLGWGDGPTAYFFPHTGGIYEFELSLTDGCSFNSTRLTIDYQCEPEGLSIATTNIGPLEGKTGTTSVTRRIYEPNAVNPTFLNAKSGYKPVRFTIDKVRYPASGKASEFKIEMYYILENEKAKCADQHTLGSCDPHDECNAETAAVRHYIYSDSLYEDGAVLDCRDAKQNVIEAWPKLRAVSCIPEMTRFAGKRLKTFTKLGANAQIRADGTLVTPINVFFEPQVAGKYSFFIDTTDGCKVTTTAVPRTLEAQCNIPALIDSTNPKSASWDTNAKGYGTVNLKVTKGANPPIPGNEKLVYCLTGSTITDPKTKKAVANVALDVTPPPPADGNSCNDSGEWAVKVNTNGAPETVVNDGLDVEVTVSTYLVKQADSSNRVPKSYLQPGQLYNHPDLKNLNAPINFAVDYKARLSQQRCAAVSVPVNLQFRCSDTIGVVRSPQDANQRPLPHHYVKWNYEDNLFDNADLDPSQVIFKAQFETRVGKGAFKYEWVLVGAPGLWYEAGNKNNEVTKEMIGLKEKAGGNGVWSFRPHPMFPGRYHFHLRVWDGCRWQEFEYRVEALCNKLVKLTTNLPSIDKAEGPKGTALNIVLTGPAEKAVLDTGIRNVYYDGIRFPNVEVALSPDFEYWERTGGTVNSGQGATAKDWVKIDTAKLLSYTGYRSNVFSPIWTVKSAPKDSFYIGYTWMGKPFNSSQADRQGNAGTYQGEWRQEIPQPARFVDEYTTSDGKGKKQKPGTRQMLSRGITEETRWVSRSTLIRVGSQEITTTLRNHHGQQLAKTCFVPDVPGQYRIQLELVDGCARKPTWRCDRGGVGSTNKAYNASLCKFNPDSTLYYRPQVGTMPPLDTLWGSRSTHKGEYKLQANCFNITSDLIEFTKPEDATRIPSPTQFAIRTTNNGRVVLDMSKTKVVVPKGGDAYQQLNVLQGVAGSAGMGNFEYNWEIESAPAGSAFKKGLAHQFVNNPHGSIASFRPDVKGVYLFVATLTDGCQKWSRQYKVEITCDASAKLTVVPRATASRLLYDHDQPTNLKKLREDIFMQYPEAGGKAYYSKLYADVTQSTRAGSVPAGCKVDYTWTLADFKCTFNMPMQPPRTPAPVANECNAKHKCSWRVIEKPCDSVAHEDSLEFLTRHADDTEDLYGRSKYGPAKHAAKINFTPDKPGTYKLNWRCEDGCSSGEDNVIVRARCASNFNINSRDFQSTFQSTNCAVSDSGFPAGGGAEGGKEDKSIFEPVCLGANGGKPDKDGKCAKGMTNAATLVQESGVALPTPVCRPLAIGATSSSTRSSPPKRCCPKCPHCPVCPACPKQPQCPSCPTCPSYQVCQVVNGIDNCTAAAQPLSVEDSEVSSETTPSRGAPMANADAPVPAPGFSSPALAAGPAGSSGTAASVAASGAAPTPQVASALKQGATAVSASKRVAMTELQATIALSDPIDAQDLSPTLRQSFVEQAESILANTMQMPVSRVHVSYEAEDRTLRVLIDGQSESSNARARLSDAFQSGALDFGEQGVATSLTINEVQSQPSPIEMGTSSDDEFDQDFDSRERTLWLSAVVPVSVLLVLSIAANVVLITHYSRMLKGARFQFRPSSSGDIYRSTPMPAL